MKIVDLGVVMIAGVPSEPWPPQIEYSDHKEGAKLLAENLRLLGAQEISKEDFPGGEGLASEEVRAITHAGTHLDAPWHFGSTSGGKPAKTIDEIPLEWCYGDGVVLDFTDMEPGGEITVDDLRRKLDEIDYSVDEGDIVLIRTDAYNLWGTREYLTRFPGMSAEATEYLIDRGVKIMGTDAYGFDKPFSEMGRRYSETGDSSELWPAHFFGREKEYCHIEKMANLDKLPAYGFKVAVFPIKIKNASAGWARPVALIEGEE